MTPSEIAFDDQWLAASKDAQAFLRSSAAAHGFLLHHHMDDWITGLFQEFDMKSKSGQLRRCAHITPAPRPVHTAAWATDLLVCKDCTGLLEPQDATADCCDKCGTEQDVLFPSFAVSGPIIMAYALCKPCALAAQQSGR